MTIRDTGMHKPKKLPRCIKCNSKNTVGSVITIRTYKTGQTACKGYFCSNCLTEFKDEDLEAKKKKTSQTAI